MVHRCCISSCGMNVRVAEAKGLSYHTFPLKEPQRDKWLVAVLPYIDKPASFKVVQGYTRICSRHFTKKDYSLDSKKRARLSSSAVPSIFPEKGSPLIIENVLENVRTLSSSIDDQDKDSPAKIPKPDLKTGNSSQDEADNTFQKPEVPCRCRSSSKETLKLSKEGSEPTKETTKKRKIRKHRVSLPKPIRDGKRKSSGNASSSVDELNIEGVGEALAEIKLSKLLSITSTSSDTEATFVIPKDWKVDLTTVKTEDTFRVQQNVGSLIGSLESLCSSVDESNSATPNLNRRVARKISDNSNVEADLLQGVKDVNINCATRDTAYALNSIINAEPSSESESDIMPLFHGFEESLLSTLRLDDSLSTLDNNQILGNTKLPYDINSPFLDNGNISSPLLDLNDIQFSALESPLQVPWDFDFNSEDILISEFQNMSAKSDSAAELTPVKKAKLPNPYEDQISLDFESRYTTDDGLGTIDTKCSTTSTCSHSGRDSPDMKRTKRRKTCGGFSIYQISDSDEDVEYYTGFPNFEKFEEFYQSIRTAAVKLKMDYEAPNSKLPEPTPGSSAKHWNISCLATYSDTHESLPLIDELFLTIVRLRKKLHETILGHMFCVSRMTVARTISSWVHVLSKMLELSTLENNVKNSSCTKNTCTDETQEAADGSSVQIPESFRRLLGSDVARNYLLKRSKSYNCRKTSSTASCPSTSKSKRPKKDKTSSVVDDEDLASVPSSSDYSATVQSSFSSSSAESETNSSNTSLETPGLNGGNTAGNGV